MNYLLQMVARHFFSFIKMLILLYQVCVLKFYLFAVCTKFALHPYVTGDMLQTGIAPTPSKHRMRRVLATDGSRDPLNGVCIFFLRPNATKPISTSNIAEVSCLYVCMCAVVCCVACTH